jgi:hypothetical protein
MLFGGGFVRACTEISLMLEAGPGLVSIAPDACEDNIMEEHYTLLGYITTSMRSVQVTASRIVGV